MLKKISVVLACLVPFFPFIPRAKRRQQFSGQGTDRSHWFRKKGIIWFNGFPGVPKLPLVQRPPRSATPPCGDLNPVASSTPEENEELVDWESFSDQVSFV